MALLLVRSAEVGPAGIRTGTPSYCAAPQIFERFPLRPMIAEFAFAWKWERHNVKKIAYGSAGR
jgi:hypothetical protein